ncbi:MAG: hypothetical protein ABI441_03690 [Flavobacterium sp.]
MDQIKKLHVLNEKVFHGLKNLNDGFDSESIKYFSESEFEIVLDRIENLKIGITGIEPWLNGEFFDVMVAEDFNLLATDSKWYRKAFLEFKERNNELLYAASYDIPENMF